MGLFNIRSSLVKRVKHLKVIAFFEYSRVVNKPLPHLLIPFIPRSNASPFGTELMSIFYYVISSQIITRLLSFATWLVARGPWPVVRGPWSVARGPRGEKDTGFPLATIQGTTWYIFFFSFSSRRLIE